MAQGRGYSQKIVCIYNGDFIESYICTSAVKDLMLDCREIKMSYDPVPVMRAQLRIKLNDIINYFEPILVDNMDDFKGSNSNGSIKNIDETIIAPDWCSSYFGIVLGCQFQFVFNGPKIDSDVDGLHLRLLGFL